MADFLADFDDPPVEVVERPKDVVLPKAQQQTIALRKLEDQIYEESSEIVRGVTMFADIPDEAGGPPPEWVVEHGEKKAEKLYRLARYGKMNKRETPVGVFIAQGTMSSIVKARSVEKAGQRVLNVTMVQFPQAKIDYPRKLVGGHE